MTAVTFLTSSTQECSHPTAEACPFLCSRPIFCLVLACTDLGCSLFTLSMAWGTSLSSTCCCCARPRAQGPLCSGDQCLYAEATSPYVLEGISPRVPAPVCSTLLLLQGGFRRHTLNSSQALISGTILWQVAKLNVPYVLMHMRGNPKTMQRLTDYTDTCLEVGQELQAQAEAAMAAGIEPWRIVLDPGAATARVCLPAT